MDGDRGIWFHNWASGKKYFIRALGKSLFTYTKRLEVIDSLVPFRYTMIKQKACIIDIYLRRLMRVVAKILRMEIILLD